MNKLTAVLNKRPIVTAVVLLALLLVGVAGLASANVPTQSVPGGRILPKGSVPNPGTQEQELANITVPAPYNVFEFVVTCAGCHGGTGDLNTAHFGNWAGGAMASSMRDPVFRANQQIVDMTVQALTGKDGAGNVCVRCHSPNAWYSGRTDPHFAGQSDTSTVENSILLSTDDEGILCEFCHRSIGSITMKRADLNPNDPAWLLMADTDDWPHTGHAYTDGPLTGFPYGDNTMQVADGLPYTGKYPGYVSVVAADLPITGTNYTGQTYAVYPPGYNGPKSPVPAGEPQFDPMGREYAYAPDGSLPTHLEVPVGPPIDPGTGWPNYQAQSISLEHPTNGKTRDAEGEGALQTTPEFCGTCHDLTVPVLNHGMPEQRTYTEWKLSSYGQDGSPTYTRCQDCHMPVQKAEYADDAPATVNADPFFSGWWPYAKDRSVDGGISMHKFDGANIDLPQMMQLLYPEPDLELIGGPTGNDNRLFGGMLSTRDPMYTKAQRNNEIDLHEEALTVQIVSGPTYNAGLGKWEVQVKITNTSGHKIPTGYPDGRRFFVTMNVKDNTGATVYQSGWYDNATAELFTNSARAPFKRALSNVIDSTSNAVMVYERVTGTCVGLGTPAAQCTPSSSLLNDVILFDNRIPPAGFDYVTARDSGGKYLTYNPTTFVPFEDTTRFSSNSDTITYRFAAAPTAVLSARAEVMWQTHTRDFMEHLKNSNTSTVRPTGPLNPLDPNYPLTPAYLSDQFADFANMTDLAGNPLRDNWGGIAYAAWLQTGMGQPFLAGAADTTVTAVPAAPAQVGVYHPLDATTGVEDPVTAIITWTAVPNAEGYLVWVRWGVSEATASWDKLALVTAPTTQLEHTMLAVGKTYGYKVQAYNAVGKSAFSLVTNFTTGVGLPDVPPTALRVVGSTSSSISLAWNDESSNEDFWLIERQDVPVAGNFYVVAQMPTNNSGGGGAVNWTDSPLPSGRTYNYRVAACNVNGCTTFTPPATGSTGGVPTAASALAATALTGRQIDLTWSPAGGSIVNYRLERSIAGPAGPWTNAVFVVNDPAAVAYSDVTVLPNTTYWYRIFATNFVGTSPASNVASATTPSEPPAAPTSLSATATNPNGSQVTLAWTDNANNEDGFIVERALGSGAGVTWQIIASNVTNPSGVTPSTVTWPNNGTSPNTTYSYRVRAFNTGGNSVYSNIVVIVTPGTEPPQAPSGMRTVKIEKTYISMAWTDNATNETTYEVYRSTNGTTFTKVATLGINATTFQNNGLTANTTYWYRVRACNAAGCSANSETISAKTKG